MTSLEHLWLGKNKITSIVGLSPLSKLRRLDVQSNRLTSVEGLESQIDTLEELYLASNGIDDKGLEKSGGVTVRFKSISVLDLSKNKIEK